MIKVTMAMAVEDLYRHRLCMVGIWILVSISVVSILGVGADPAGDATILQAFKAGITNSDVLGWTATNPCNWNSKMVVCDTAGNVNQLRVRNLSLTGTVTPDINKLTSLTYLELNYNNFQGAMPTLSGLTNLQHAFLDDNQFSTIPGDFFDGLTSIIEIYIDNNPLNVSSGGWIIPGALQYDTTLTLLSMNNVSATGAIPSFLGSMTSLTTFRASYNNFLGGIPGSFNTSNLATLWLNNQAMNGSIDVVGGMTSLKELWLQGNQFTGTVPDGLASAAGLSSLRINTNKLVGRLSSGLSSLPLQELLMNNNYLTGELPVFSTVVASSFSYDSGSFCGAAGVACSAKVNVLLDFLAAAGWPEAVSMTWTGPDPCTGWTGVTCDATTGEVISIVLRQDSLVGSISPTLANLTSLTTLILSGNTLTGTIPSQLTSLTSLKTVDVSNNNLSGPLPSFAASVKFIYTGNALLTGSVAPSPSGVASPGTSPVGTPSSPGTSPAGPPSSPGTSPTAGNPPASSTAPGSTGSTGTGSISPGSSPVNGTVSPGHSPSSSKVNLAPVLGGVTGGAGLCAIIGALVIFCYCRKKKRPGLNGMVVHPRDSEPEMLKVVVNHHNSSSSSSSGVSNQATGSSTENGSLTLGDSMYSSSLSKDGQVWSLYFT